MWLRRTTNMIGIPLIIVFVILAYIEITPEQEEEVINVDRSFEGIEADTGYVVSAANPKAVKAGMDILEQGGNAIDAALAISFALSVVEPYGSGIGGGGSMLLYDPTRGEEDPVQYIDYRETAPLNLVSMNGQAISAANTDKMSDFGVPGFLKGMDYLYEEYATKPLADLLSEAIDLAENGFEVDKHLFERFYYAQNRLNPDEIPHYFPENTFIQKGNTLIQQDLANTFKGIVDSGDMGSYLLNDLAPDMVNAFPILSKEDFQDYEVLLNHPPVKGEFLDYTVYSAPPPLGGAVFIQALQMAELMNLNDHTLYRLPEYVDVESGNAYVNVKKPEKETNKALTDIEREQVQSYVDFIEKMVGINYETYLNRLTNIGDPNTSQRAREREADLTTVETSTELIQKWEEYVAEKQQQRRFEDGREEDILEDGTESHVPPTYVKNDKGMYVEGTNKQLIDKAVSFFDAEAEINQHNNTTHFVIIDRAGRMVSATHTLSNFFGSGKYHKGFFLNDQLSNFSETPGSINEPFPGRRPRSFMSPSILVKESDDGVEEMIGIGSPGGGRIPIMMAQVLINYSMYDIEFDEAMTYMTRFQFDYNEGKAKYEIRLEPKFRELENYDEIIAELSDRGYDVTIEVNNMYFGGIQAAVYDGVSGKLSGYADPRRGGTADGKDESKAPSDDPQISGTTIPVKNVSGTIRHGSSESKSIGSQKP